MNRTKCLEYYLDSKIYTEEEIQNSIDDTKKEFKNKQIDVKIKLNDYGVYIITFYIAKKITILSKIIIKFKKRRNEKLLLREANASNRKYGMYKPTRTYKPL